MEPRASMDLGDVGGQTCFVNTCYGHLGKPEGVTHRSTEY